jgi:hypothetical protein
MLTACDNPILFLRCSNSVATLSPMPFEMEFLLVGDASKAGDAIVARYGANGQYAVTVIDGGTQDSGDALVAHIKRAQGIAGQDFLGAR